MPTLALLFERVIGSQMYNFIASFIPQSQYGFVKGTGAQDCGTTTVFIQTFEGHIFHGRHKFSIFAILFSRIPVNHKFCGFRFCFAE